MDAQWSFLTNHARVLVCIARDDSLRLRDIADMLGVTERTVFGIVTDLTEAGYVVKEKAGRRNRYRIQHHLPLRKPIGREPTIGELLGLLIDSTATNAAGKAAETGRAGAHHTADTLPGPPGTSPQ
ncbi:helix-turn-helix domain-containing protein [Microlunatus sp. Gsoil 973]|uniref:helix-turn-helix transcriptional regulator n=1 Tax=Microlunatus sp. Gsoil 973 TaxID=2672569 RepID=UPI0012B47F56|nr:helix-turn-helix domain-containing protein [Microlunatus sp. Gsoil 973]QGN34451.1 MarR family transcriptional regulator [Microlunatus sp. Gsoil 973]